MRKPCVIVYAPFHNEEMWPLAISLSKKSAIEYLKKEGWKKNNDLWEKEISNTWHYAKVIEVPLVLK